MNTKQLTEMGYDSAKLAEGYAPAHCAEGQKCAQCGELAWKIELVPFCMEHSQASLMEQGEEDRRAFGVIVDLYWDPKCPRRLYERHRKVLRDRLGEDRWNMAEALYEQGTQQEEVPRG